MGKHRCDTITNDVNLSKVVTLIVQLSEEIYNT